MSKRGKRGPATCGKKNPEYIIEFDGNGKPTGTNANQFISELRAKMKDKFEYYIPFSKFPKYRWQQLWMDIKHQWNIPNDEAKATMINRAKKAHTNWRSLLTINYVRKKETPFDTYTKLDSTHWAEFVAERSTKAFLEKSSKARESAMKNTNPTRLGRRGFAALKPNLEAIWSHLVPMYTFLEDIKDERSRMWIDKLEKEMIEDNSYYSGKEDPMTRLLGPEHGGRSRTVSNIIGSTKVKGGLFQGGRQKSKDDESTTQTLRGVS